MPVDGDIYRFRAVLSETDEGGDLYIFTDAGRAGSRRCMPRTSSGGAACMARSHGWRTNEHGSLKIYSENSAIGRDRWEQILTIAYRGTASSSSPVTPSAITTRSIRTGPVKCDVNLLTGKWRAQRHEVQDQAAQATSRRRLDDGHSSTGMRAGLTAGHPMMSSSALTPRYIAARAGSERLASDVTSRSILQDLKFKYSWRSYQQRVLEELDSHLDDAQLHVVAAPRVRKDCPGSGGHAPAGASRGDFCAVAGDPEPVEGPPCGAVSAGGGR